MITILDTTSWSKDLVTSNAEFVEVGGTFFVVSNVRQTGGFGSNFGADFGGFDALDALGAPNVTYDFHVLKSDPVPPAPGPGATFSVVASYIFPQPNTTFDPAVAYDPLTGKLHIVGTRDTPVGSPPTTSDPLLSDIIKFTFDTGTNALAGPSVLAAAVGSRVRGAYDVTVLTAGNIGNTVVAASVVSPTIPSGSVQSISVLGNIVTITVSAMSQPFVPGQLILMSGLQSASFLNGVVLQVVTASATQLTADYIYPGGTGFGNNFGLSFGSSIFTYNTTPENPAIAAVRPVGNSLVAMELDSTDSPVAGTTSIIASSPSRSGLTYDGVSLLSTSSGVELYWQTHPKQVAFADQTFSIYESQRQVLGDFGLNFGASFGNTATALWGGFGVNFGQSFGVSAGSSLLTQYLARYSDIRLTVLMDSSGNRYMSQIYFNQLNHPEGLVGSALLGSQPAGGAWFFHPTLGSVASGSIVDGDLVLSDTQGLHFTYLLEPFDAIPPPTGLPASYAFHVASVDTNSMSITDMPDYYNSQTFTWLRGTKSIIDDPSLWAAVGESEIVSDAIESHLIPATAPYSLLVGNAGTFWQDDGVIDTSGVQSLAYSPTITVPTAKGQYVAEPNGLYTFYPGDASVGIIGIDITNNILTVTGSNISNFSSGMKVLFGGVTHSSYLNGQVVTITAVNVSLSTFTAAFTHADDPEHSDTGLAGKPLTISYTYISAITPLYISDFNVPPVAAIFPTSLTVYRAQPVTFSAAGSTDANNDPLTYIWSENDPSLTNVTLSASGALATLNVSRAVGGAARTLNVGVAVVDTALLHPPTDVTNIAADSLGNITVTASTSLAVGETVMLYDIALAPPAAPTFGTPITVNGFGLVFGSAFGGAVPPVTTYYVQLTYVNAVGETTASAESTITVPAGQVPVVNSPGPQGNATGYNIYMGTTSGSERLQTAIPIPIGFGIDFGGGFGGGIFSLPLSGLTSGTVPPSANTAFIEEVNDKEYTLTSWSPTQFVATTSGSLAEFPSTPVAGFEIQQFQYAIASVTVPYNAPPTITFPQPPWSTSSASITGTSVLGNVLTVTASNSFTAGQPVLLSGTDESFLNGQIIIIASASPTQFTANFAQMNYINNSDAGTATALPSISAPRNSTIELTQVINDPATQFLVEIGGVTDPDDLPTYQWEQLFGTPVIPGLPPPGQSSPIVPTETLEFSTNGVKLEGDTLVFRLTVNDGVNPAVSAACAVNVAAYAYAGIDSKKLSRSVWQEKEAISAVTLASDVLTITASNTFSVGQQVTFSGLTNAAFLNGQTAIISSLIGAGPTYTGFTAPFQAANFVSAGFGLSFGTNFGTVLSVSDTGYASVLARLSQRNTAQTWSALDQSALYTNFAAVKRTSVLSGTDRYILISPYSVMVFAVYGGAPPSMALLRKLFTPESTLIIDAAHLEDDTTLVLDSTGMLYRYSTAPLINTDNPDASIKLSAYSSMRLEKIFAGESHGNIRILALTGPDGCLLVQVASDTLIVQGTLALTTASTLVVGSNNVQFVRLNNVESLSSGKVLIGTVTNLTAAVTAAAVSSNALTITCANTFKVGDAVAFSGFTGTTAFLNGLTVSVITRTDSGFTASLGTTDLASTSTASSSLATALYNGTTYETLIDLAQNQIIGTWNASKLKNQFVNTGEILFEPNSSYSGRPIPPILSVPVTSGSLVTLSWAQERPDLVAGYTVEYASQPIINNIILGAGLSYAASNWSEDVQVVDATLGYGSLFGQSFGTHIVLVRVASLPGPGQYAVSANGTYTFNAAQLGHNLTIIYRTPFTALQTINSGAIQTTTFALAPGSYAFRVNALSKDGASGYSNVQALSS